MDTGNRKKIVLGTVISLVFVGLVAVVYFAGRVVLPGLVQQYYEGKDCGMVISVGETYGSIYGLDERILLWSAECASYTEALALEEGELWQDAYQAYALYLVKYPNGLFVEEANRQMVASLFGFVVAEVGQGNYQVGLRELERFMDAYPASPEFDAVRDEYIGVYRLWREALVADGEFRQAERLLEGLRDRAALKRDSKLTDAANVELAFLYTDWAKAYEQEGQVELAIGKYRQAIAIDELSSAGSQAKEYLVALLLLNGEALRQAGDFEAAIRMYEQGLSEYPSESQDQLRLEMIQASAEWALALAGKERYSLALGKLDEMEGLYLLPGEEAEQIFADTRGDVYRDLSNSSGEEAAQWMQQAMTSICEGRTAELPPIFGLDESQVLFVMHGIKDAQLPDGMVAKTPGQMHYVVCGEFVQTILESKTVRMVPFRNNVQIRSLSRDETFNRVRYSWEVEVFHVPTRELAGKTQVWGTDPPLLSYLVNTTYLLYDYQTKTPLHGGSNHPIPTSTFGGAPSIFDLVYWLEKNILGQ